MFKYYIVCKSYKIIKGELMVKAEKVDEEFNEEEGVRRVEPKDQQWSFYSKALFGILIALAVLAGINQMLILGIYATPASVGFNPSATSYAAGASTNAQGSGNGQSASSSQTAQSTLEILPKGIPAIYGAELGIKYDDISEANPTLTQQTINKLASFDDGIVLQGEDLKRYVLIASSIACEYCCGATTLVNSNGQPACGCAHSYAMRGLGKYLIKNHGKEYTDMQILEEMAKWKTLFFPGPLVQKAAVLKQQGIEFNYVNLASNKYRGIENGASVVASGSGAAQQVGGC